MKKIILILCLIVSFAGHCYSFETSTHSELSRHAVNNSNLDNFLKNQLGLSDGILEPITRGGETRNIRGWVQEGSIREDDQLRFFNHFHNPLKTWNQAGLHISGGISSVLWAQNPSQGNAWSNARQSYFEALTATDESEREEKFADTFRALGQLIHLVQDAAVPAHTRNDPHPPWNPDALERFTDTSPGHLPVATLDSLVGTPVSFSSSVLECAPNDASLVRIACITDTTDSEQTQATPSAGINQGIAEYSNANFLSGDTIFKDFTFPRLSSVDLTNPFTLNNRRYYQKVADGETGFFLVAEGTFTDRLLSLSWFDKGFTLDPLVTLDYASLLLRRAVGYSAGLIDYFFRGDILAVLSEFRDLEGIIGVRVQNRTENEETATGSMVLVGEYQVDSVPSFVILGTETVTLTRDSQEVIFNFPPNSIPEGVLLLRIVYRGPLGLEEDSVIVTVVTAVCDPAFDLCVE